jgi:hypothetical protein
LHTLIAMRAFPAGKTQQKKRRSSAGFAGSRFQPISAFTSKLSLQTAVKFTRNGRGQVGLRISFGCLQPYQASLSGFYGRAMTADELLKVGFHHRPKS